MRKFLFIMVGLMALSNAAYADTIKAGVNGMVCAFCATGVEKSFKAEPAVDSVKVDLETKLVTITTKANQNLDDDVVKKVITEAGYTVTDIEREKDNGAQK